MRHTPDPAENQSTDSIFSVSRETESRSGRFFLGTVLGAIVGALVAGLIVVSLGDPQRIYVTETVESKIEINNDSVTDSEALSAAVALDDEMMSGAETTPVSYTHLRAHET